MSNFHIYIRKTYTTIWAKYKRKRNVQTKKCYFYYRENTIYIGWGRIQKKKEVSSIYKKTPIISIYSQNTTVWARYKRKERVLYRQNTPYIRKNNAYVKEISYMGLYKSSLPNLKYCYIKKDAWFCRLVLPLGFATWFSHQLQPCILTTFLIYIASFSHSDYFQFS